MKRSIFLLVAFIMTCWSCQDQGSIIEQVSSEPNTRETRTGGIINVNKNDFILVQIVPSTVSSNTTNKFVIVNNTNHELYWNTIYTLEYYERNNWQSITIQGDWIDIGYMLYPSEFFSNDIITGGMTLFSLVRDFNSGKKGQYRLLGKLTIPDFGRYDLVAEFEII